MHLKASGARPNRKIHQPRPYWATAQLDGGEWPTWGSDNGGELEKAPAARDVPCSHDCALGVVAEGVKIDDYLTDLLSHLATSFPTKRKMMFERTLSAETFAHNEPCRQLNGLANVLCHGCPDQASRAELYSSKATSSLESN
jgi:hypothetical protein